MDMAVRKPNPFLPFFASREWRIAGNARLDGKEIDLSKAFRELGWDDLAKIEVRTDRGWIMPWRDGDPMENVPYKGTGTGYMSREELSQSEYSDTDLERLSKELFGITITLSGEDTPEKRYLREKAYDRVAAAETGKILP